MLEKRSSGEGWAFRRARASVELHSLRIGTGIGTSVSTAVE